MIKFWDYFPKNEHPFVKIIRIRSDPSSSLPPELNEIKNNTIYLSLPTYNHKQITRFNELLTEGKSLMESLRQMPFTMKFEYEIIKSYQLNSLTSPIFSTQDLLMILYQCMAWITQESEKREQNELLTLIAFLNSNIYNPLAHFYGEIIKSFINISISEPQFEIDVLYLNCLCEHLIINKNLDSSFSSSLISLLNKVIDTHNKEFIERILTILAVLFEDDRQSVHFENFSLLASPLTEFINDLDQSSLIIMSHASNLTDNQLIIDSFIVLPNNMYTHLSMHDPIFDLSDFIQENEIPINYETSEDINLPLENLLISETNNITDDKYICKLIHDFIPILQVASEHAVESFSQSVLSVIDIESPQQIDFIVMIANFLKYLKTSIPSVTHKLFSSVVFDKDLTIFHGLPESVKQVRSMIFSTVSEINPALLCDALDISYQNNLLFAEYATRIAYLKGCSFFGNEAPLSSLITAFNLIQNDSNECQQSDDISRSVLLYVLFSLLEDPRVALNCLTKTTFCTTFLNLMFNPNFTSLVAKSLFKCIAQFPALPEPVIMFVSLIFNSCITHKNDQEFNSIARELVKVMIQSISHNINIGCSFAPIFDITLEFLASCKTAESLEMEMLICSLIAQSQSSFDVTSTRFSLILESIHNVEGDDPSDSTLLNMRNWLSLSTNLALDLMFTIQIPDVVPLIIVTFSKSNRLEMIIEMFYKLCLFSVKNITACHEGNLDLILLKAINGTQIYNGNVVEFKISAEIVDAILKLTSLIVSFRTSIMVDKAILDLILPRNDHTFNPYATTILRSLHSLFVNQMPIRNAFQICHNKPAFTLTTIKSSQLNNGFSFSFMAKVDISLLKQTNARFIFLEIKDEKNRVFDIYHIQETLFVRYDGDLYRTSAPFAKTLPTNQWVFITVFIIVEDDETTVTFRYEDQLLDDIIFKPIIFQEDITISIGRIDEGPNTSVNDISPVSMGPYAMLLPPFEERTYVTLRDDIIRNQTESYNVLFTYLSKSITPDLSVKRNEFSTQNVMPLHIRFHDLFPIFSHLENAPPQYAETAITMMMVCTDFTQRIRSGKIDILSPTSPIPIFKDMTGLPDSLFTFGNYTSHYIINISEITFLFSLIMRSKNIEELLNQHLYTAFFSMLDYVDDEDILVEILENILFNVWVWFGASETSFKKIMRLCLNSFSQYTFPPESELFNIMLIQTYYISRFSSKSRELIDQFRFKILEILPLANNSLKILTAIITSITDDEVELIKYLDFMTRLVDTKKIIVPLNLLLSILRRAQTASKTLFIKLIRFVCAASGTELQTILTQLALMTPLASFDDEMPKTLDIVCILSMKSKSSTTMSDFLFHYHTVPSSNWFFWPILATLSFDNEIQSQAFSFIISIISKLTEDRVTDFMKIMNLLDFLEPSRVFDVKKFRTDLLLQFLDTLLKSNEKMEKSLLYKIILRVIISQYWKFRASSFSNKLLREMKDDKYAQSILQNYEMFKQEIKMNCNEFGIDFMEAIMGFRIDNYELYYRAPREENHAILKLIRIILQNNASIFDDDSDTILVETMKFIDSTLKDTIKINQRAIPLFDMLRPYVEKLIVTMKFQLVDFRKSVNPNYQFRFNTREILSGMFIKEYSRISYLYYLVENSSSHTAPSATRFLPLPLNKSPRQKFKNRLFKEPFNWNPSTFIDNEKIVTLLSISCHRTSFSGQVPIGLRILTSEIHISQYKKPIVVLDYNQISMIIPINPYSILIYLTGCHSFMIDFDNKINFKTAIDIMKTHNLPLVSEQILASLFNRWYENHLSNFDFILGLNFYYGYNFNDSSHLPVFPLVNQNGIVKYNKVGGTDYQEAMVIWHSHFDSAFHEFDIEKELKKLEKQGFVPPSIFFDFEILQSPHIKFPDWCQDRFELIFTYRNWLESPKVRYSLIKWIDIQFGSSILPKEIAPKNEQVVESEYPIRRQKHIKVCRFLRDGFDSFFVLFENGTIEIYNVDTIDNMPALSFARKFKPKLQLSSECFFETNEQSFIIADVGNSNVYRVHTQAEMAGCSMYITNIASCGDRFVYVVDRSIVMVSPSYAFPYKSKFVSCENDPILYIAAQPQINAVAYFTEGLDMKVVSIYSGRILGKYQFQEKITKMMFTYSMAFIVVESAGNVYIFAANASLIKVVQIKLRIFKWATARSSKGTDLVVFIDSANNLVSMDVTEPENFTVIYKCKKYVLDLKVLRNRKRVMMIGSDSIATFIPVTHL